MTSCGIKSARPQPLTPAPMLPKRYVFPRSHNNLTSCILDAAEERRLGLVPRSRKSVAVIYETGPHISPASTVLLETGRESLSEQGSSPSQADDDSDRGNRAIASAA